jgi:predicted GNAT family acetyltransferase
MGVSQEVQDEFAKDPVREAVKKKEDTESVSEDGLSESQISDEQAELMRNFSGSGFESLSTEEIKEQFQTTSGPSSVDVAEDPERYKVVTGADGFDEVIDLEAEDPELRKQNIEKYEISQMSDDERYTYEGNEKIDLYHPDLNIRQQNRRNYIQRLNQSIPSMGALMQRGMGASQAADEITKRSQRRDEIAQKFREEKERADGILKQPSFYDVLYGDESLVELPAGFEEFKERYMKELRPSLDDIDFSKTTEEDPEEYMMRTIYEERVKRKDRELKKEAGYVEVNGVYMDPNNLDFGFGFDAALNSLSFTGGKTAMSDNGISLKNESVMESMLENKFKQYGFSVTQDVIGSDYITITGPDGSSKQFNLEKTGNRARMIANDIKAFINKSYNNADFSLEQKAQQAGVMPSDVDVVGIEKVNPEEIMFGRSRFATKQGDIILKERAKLEKVFNSINAKTEEVDVIEKQINDLFVYNDKFQSRDGTITFRDSDVQERYETLQKRLGKVYTQRKELADAGALMESDFNKATESLKHYEGERALMLANAWDIEDVPGFAVGEFMRGVGGVVSGYTRLGHDIYSNINNLFYNETDEEYITDQERKNYKQGLAMTRDMRGMSNMSKETQQAIRESGGIFTEGIFGLVGSLPAMFTGPASIPSFAAMSVDAVSSEMEKIPAFANISENEKLALTIPIGVTVGVLERFGFRNALNNSSLISRITINGLKKFGAQNLAKEGTKKTFQEIIESSALGTMKKAGILVASSAASEFETGSAQQLAEVYAKEIYDYVKDKDFFKQSVSIRKDDKTGERNLVSWDLAKETLRAGATEAVGGFVMGMPNGISRAVIGERLPQVSNLGFDLFRLLNTSENVEKTIAAQKINWYSKVGVKENPQTGEKYTKKDIDDMFNLYEGIIGQSREIKEEYSSEYQKEILQRLIKRKQLEEEVGKYDKSTTKEQQRQIAVINEDIAELTSRAEKRLEVDKKRYEKAKSEGYEGDFISFVSGTNLAEQITNSVQEETAEEQEQEEAVPAPIEQMTNKDFLQYKKDVEEGKLDDDIRDGILSRVADKEAGNLELTPLQQQVKNLNEARYNEIVALKESQRQRDEVAKQEAQEKKQAVEQEIKQEEESFQQALDAEWNNETPQNRETALEAAEKQLKEEKGPGRRRMLIGRRQAPVITEEEILQRAKENLYELNQSLLEEEVSPTTPTQDVTLVENPTRSQQKQGNVYTIKQDGKDVGEVMFIENSKGEIVVQDVEVSNESQKKGIATKAYQAINEMAGDKKVVSSNMFVEEGGVKAGERLWESLVRKNLAVKTKTGFEMVKQKAEEKIELAEPITRVTKQMKQQFEDGTMSEETVDGILSHILQKEEQGKKLTPFQERLKQKNKARYNQLVSSATLRAEAQELEGLIQEEESSPDFRRKTKEDVKEDVVDETESIVEEINEIPSPNTGLDVSSNELRATGTKIDKKGLLSRLKNKIPFIKNLDIIKNIPVVFNISDQLTTGNTVNPQTGNTIDRLMGGLGFTGVEGHENLAWASVNEKTANDFYRKAEKAYKENKEVLEKFWEANPQYAGLVPMPVVKMGEVSMLSNEAVMRVFLDNLTKIPKKNQNKALGMLVQELENVLPKLDKAEQPGVRNFIKAVKKAKPKTFNEILNVEFLRKNNVSLGARRAILRRLTVGSPNVAGLKKKSAGSPQSPIPKALLEGMGKGENELVSLSKITDAITEKAMEDVPANAIIAVQGVEVAKKDSKGNWVESGGVAETRHPNYPAGIIGKTIGILENPVSLADAFPVAYQRALEGIMSAEQTVDKEGKPKFKTKKNIKDILSKAFFLSAGIPMNSFIGALSKGNIDNLTKLTSFLNTAFPNVQISTDQASFDNVMSSDRVKKYIKKGDIIYGVTVDGDIYINPQVHNSDSELFNTAIHEMGHVWQSYLLTTPEGKKLYDKGVNLVKQTAEYQRQLKVFNGNEKKAAHEAMAILIGNKGQNIADASIKSKFKEWLIGMWNYIRDKFKMSKDLTAKEVQNMTMDEFIGTALADMMSGKPIKITEEQQKQMKNPEVFFREGDNALKIVARGRENGFSDASIREVLKGRGFSAEVINEVMTVPIDTVTALPRAFEKVEGGVNDGKQLFSDVQQKLRDFSVMGPRGGTQGRRQRTKTYAEIREKAQELLKAHPIFKAQSEQVQMELLMAFDRTLQTNASSSVQAQMAAIRKTLKERKIAEKNLRELQRQLKKDIMEALPKGSQYSKATIKRMNALISGVTVDNYQAQLEKLIDEVYRQKTRMENADIRRIEEQIRTAIRERKIGVREGQRDLRNVQIRLRNYIRLALPASNKYTRGAITRMNRLITNLSEKNYNDTIEKVEKEVENQRAKMKRDLIKDLVKEVRLNAKKTRTRSGKIRARGKDARGQLYFEESKPILDAIVAGDMNTLLDIMADLADKNVEIGEAMLKEQRGETLTTNEERLLTRVQAFDTFGRVPEMELEEIQQLYDTILQMKGESIANLKNIQEERRRQRALKEAMVTEQIRETNPEFFDEDGNLLDENELAAKKDEIQSEFAKKNIKEGIRKWFSSSFKFTSLKSMLRSARNSMLHLGSLMTIADRTTEGKSVFTDNVYKNLNRMSENENRGVYDTTKKINTLAKSVGIIDGLKGVKRKLATGIHTFELTSTKKGTKYKTDFNADQLMRIYALSLNEVQNAKLKAQGIGTNEINRIKEILGPDMIEFTEKVVDFLSGEYYEQINQVYSQQNNINLGYIENYFPTKTTRTKVDNKMIMDGDFNGVFSAETSPAFKERIDKTSDINLKEADFMSTLTNHVDTMEKYMAYADGLRQMTDFFKIPAVDILLQELNIKSDTKFLVNQTVNPNAGISPKNELIQTLGDKFTGFALAFKAIQILKQATSFVNAFEEYSYRGKGKSKIPGVDAIMFMIDFVKVFGTLPKDLFGKGPISEAMEISATFRKRVEQGIEGDVYGLESGSKTFKRVDKNSSRWKKAKALFKTAAASPTVLGDIMGVMGYMINYKRNIKNGMSKAEALEAFNDYNATQQSRRGTDKNRLQFSNNALVRTFTMFGSVLFLQMNKVYSSALNIGRDTAKSYELASKGKIKEARKASPKGKDIRAFYLNLAVANILFVIAGNLAKIINGDDDDRDAVLDKMQEAMFGLNQLYKIPLLGPAFSRHVMGNKFTPDIVNPLDQIAYKIKKAKDKKERIIPLIEIIIGAQVDPIVGLFNAGFGADEDFEDNMMDALGISKSYRPGSGSGSSGGKKKKSKKESFDKFDSFDDFDKLE